MLVERYTPYEQKPRIGLVVALDLEKYEYGQGSKSLVRPTEGTIVERLPPRIAIRKGAPLELPHIMVLLDDPNRSVIEPLYEKRTYFPQGLRLRSDDACRARTRLVCKRRRTLGARGGGLGTACGPCAFPRKIRQRRRIALCRRGRQPFSCHGQGHLGRSQGLSQRPTQRRKNSSQATPHALL